MKYSYWRTAGGQLFFVVPELTKEAFEAYVVAKARPMEKEEWMKAAADIIVEERKRG